MDNLAFASRSPGGISSRALSIDLGSVFAALAGDGERLDGDGAFPVEALAALRAVGGLTAPIPQRLGGLGLGTDEAGAQGIMELLSGLGRANLCLGRVFEAHVNALRLICRYGTRTQIETACADARDGHLYGLWITDQHDALVQLLGGELVGRKAFASGVGVATRALITLAVPEQGECMAVIDLVANRVVPLAWFDLHGMRAAATAQVDLTGVSPDCIIGAPEDYMRQPEISLGAWRGLAVMHGGLMALVEALEGALTTRGRDADPHQRARLGRCLIAQETATLWVRRCAELAEADDAGEAAANYVKLARIAVEQACLQVIEAAQRSVGIAAMVRPNPIERLCCDLTTYLRQPALDMVLDEAAAYFVHRRLP